MKQPCGVILAGGLATRMGGGDKGRLLLDDRSILSHVIERLENQVDQIALNANGNTSRFNDLNLPVMPDSVEGFAGPLAGVLAGLDWAAEIGAEQIVTVAGDTPFFPCDLVPQLQLAAEMQNSDLVLATTPDGRQPTFGLWPVRLRDDLRAALVGGLRKVVLWTEHHNAAEAKFQDSRAFFNVNTPADLKTAQEMR